MDQELPTSARDPAAIGVAVSGGARSPDVYTGGRWRCNTSDYNLTMLIIDQYNKIKIYYFKKEIVPSATIFL